LRKRARSSRPACAQEKAGTLRPAVTEPSSAGPSKIYLVARPNSVQTSFVVGAQSMARTNPDFVPLTVANRVLGGAMGRLFRHLREQKGYTYSVFSNFSATDHRGTWQVATDVRTDVTEPALTDLMADIGEMRDKPVPRKSGRRQARDVAGFALSLETPQQMLG
jgi:zinc protease